MVFVYGKQGYLPRSYILCKIVLVETSRWRCLELLMVGVLDRLCVHYKGSNKRRFFRSYYYVIIL